MGDRPFDVAYHRAGLGALTFERAHTPTVAGAELQKDVTVINPPPSGPTEEVLGTNTGWALRLFTLPSGQNRPWLAGTQTATFGLVAMDTLINTITLESTVRVVFHTRLSSGFVTSLLPEAATTRRHAAYSSLSQPTEANEAIVLRITADGAIVDIVTTSAIGGYGNPQGGARNGTCIVGGTLRARTGAFTAGQAITMRRILITS